MEFNAQPRPVLVPEERWYGRRYEPNVLETPYGRVSGSASGGEPASGYVRPCGAQQSRTAASTSVEDESFDLLASLIPSQDFNTPGHLDSSLWHATLCFISRLTGDRIDSAFDLNPGGGFQMNDNGCRETLLRIVPVTCLLNDFGASRNLQAASAAASFIRLLLDGRVQLSRPAGDVEHSLQTVKVPEQREKEAKEHHLRSPVNLFPVDEEGLDHTTASSTTSDPTPLVSSREAIERMEEQMKNRAAQLEYRDSDDFGDYQDPPTGPRASAANTIPPAGPRARGTNTTPPTGPRASGANTVSQILNNHRALVRRREQAMKRDQAKKQARIVKAAKARLLENVNSFQGVKKLVKKGLSPHQTAAEARARVQPLLSAITDLEAAIRESPNDSTSN